MSKTTFVGPQPWDEVKAACRTAGPRNVAIAYLGVDAADMLKLNSRDTLIVNAGTSALMQHATSPVALKKFVDAGVAVFSSSRLHAKVIATSKMAVIGSMNASANSTRMDEAAVVTDNMALVRSAHKFVQGLTDLTAVDADFLRDARAKWKLGADNRVTGTSKPVETEGDVFLPKPIRRLGVTPVHGYSPSQAENRAFRAAERRVRLSAGPAATYFVTSYRPKPGDSALHPGDVLILTEYDDSNRTTGLFPPQVVISEAITVPSRRSHFIYLIRGRVDLDPRERDDAEARLNASGVTKPRLDDDHWVSRSDIAAFLALWGLP